MNELNEEVKGNEIIDKRICDEYIRLIHKNTEFFSLSDPATLYGLLDEFAEEGGSKLVTHEKKYKGHLEIPYEEGE